MALDYASRLRWALALPRVLWLRTSPPGGGGLWRCHVSRGSLCATSFKHKEMPSRPACAARPACSQGTRAHFHGASRQGLHAPARCAGGQCSQYLQGVRIGIYNAATVWVQYDTSTLDHSPGTATVPSDSTARCETTDQVQRGRRQDQACPHR
jgi:hypothetical protein